MTEEELFSCFILSLSSKNKITDLRNQIVQWKQNTAQSYDKQKQDSKEETEQYAKVLEVIRPHNIKQNKK